MLSDIDADAMAMVTVNSKFKLACLVSDIVRLIFIIILQVRESASSQSSQSELAPNYSLLLLTALMHLMRTFIEESLPLTCNLRLSHDAQKHVRFVIVP